MIVVREIPTLRLSEEPARRRRKRATPGIMGPFIAAMLVALLFFGAIGAWSAMAPLQSAAVAPGVVAVESNRKTIQHLEGGLVESIAVREGDWVRAGQVLIRLSDTQPRAARNVLVLQLSEQQLIQERLQAELGGSAFEPVMPAVVDPATWQRMRQDQQRIMSTRRTLLESQLGVVEQKVAQALREIEALNAQITSDTRQIELIVPELTDMQTLLRSGLVPRSRVLSLERRQAELEGSRAIAQATIGRYQEAILEAKVRKTELAATFANDLSEQLRASEAQLRDLGERLRVASDALERLQIRSPLDGRVVGLLVHTLGGVITPGQPLMDIVPTQEGLIIEARVEPKDVDSVKVGQEAQIRFLSFNQRNTHPIEGRVISVAGDRLLDPRTGQPYFLVRVRPVGEVERPANRGELQPGMPADVIVLTGKRTVLDYLLEPLTRSMTRALRES